MARLALLHRRGRTQAIGLALATAVSVLVPIAVLTGAAPAGATAVAPDPGPIAEVAMGATSACALAESGGLFCWGDNSKGQLGDGTRTDSTRPIPVTTAGTPLAGKTIAHVAVGGGRACAVTTDGKLACWGQNTFGGLGVGDQNDRLLPTALGGALSGATVTSVALGEDHGCATTSTGAAVCWGSNGNGQVGNGTTSTAFTPTSVVTAGTPMAGKQIVQVTAGDAHSCATSADGVAFCWGIGGALGDGGNGGQDEDAPVAVVVAGTPFDGKAIAEVRATAYGACARATDGTLGCWGDGSSGQLGGGSFGVFTEATVPQAVTTAGTGLAGKTVTQLSAGDAHVCARASDGSAACWGANARSQLGNRGTVSSGLAFGLDLAGTVLSSSVAEIVAGGSSTCGVSGTGQLACWGFNHTGQLGLGSEGQAKVPAPVVAGVLAGQAIQEVAGGYFFACARTSTSVACWGSNEYGQVGDGTTTTRAMPVALATSGTVLAGKSIAAMAVGHYHACALATDDTLACWGRGASGRLGDGASTNRTTPRPVTLTGTALAGKDITSIAAGGDHTCATTTDGTVACWGFNAYGQLGDGTITTRTMPTAVTRTGTPLDGHVAVQLALGKSHTCARTDVDGLACWGNGDFGLLGTGVSSPPDALVPAAVTTTGTPLGGKAIGSLVAGWYHNCARTTDGIAACWGNNSGGQLGNGGTTIASTPTAVTLSGALGGGPVAHIAANDSRTCASTASSVIACFGEQTNGSLGNGTSVAKSLVPVVVATAGTPLAGATIAGLGQLYTASCAVTSLGTVSCWGANSQGQLGNGVPVSEPVPTPPLWASGGATAPGAPGVVIAVRGNQQVDLTWSAPASDGGSVITGYVITPYIGAVAQTPIPTSGTGTTKTVTGLLNGTTYTFKVAATNAVGTGAQSAATSPVTPATVPGAPSLNSYGRGDRSVSMSWTAPASNGGSPITGYVITPYIGAAAQTPIELAGTGTSHVVTGLTNGTAYTFRLAARNAVGVGATTTTIFAITPAGVPVAPSIGSVVAGDAQATLSWSAVGGNGSTISAYVITPYIGAVAQAPIESTGTGTSKTVTGLVNGTTYTFTVAGKNAVGIGTASSKSAAVTPTSGATAPGAPTIGAVTASNGSANVTWIAPASNGGDPISAYVVTPSIDGVAQAPVVSSGTATSFLVPGLTNGTTYTFTVAARNGVGDSAPSGASAAVTPDTPAPFASWVLFVRRQHQDLTGVLPSASVENAQANALANGSQAKGDLIETLRTGTDNLTNVDPTARLYRAFLGRTPDPGGLKFWLGRRRSGSWTLTRIADSFATSNEFVRKYGSLSNRQFVTRIYTDVLGRTADQAGVDYWTKKLDTKSKTRGGVMVGFSESNEYKRKQANNTDAAVAYIFLLGRAPTSTDLAAWIADIEGGATRAELATEILDSAAYATRITG